MDGEASDGMSERSRMMNPQQQNQTPEDHAVDAAIDSNAESVMRLADGEGTAEELAEFRAMIEAMPDGDDRVVFERRLHAACGRVMRHVPIPTDLRERVGQAVHWRLRGERDGAALVMFGADPESAPRYAGDLSGSPEAAASSTGSGGRRWRQFALAASLVLGGFLAARFAGTNDPAPTTRALGLSNTASAIANKDARRVAAMEDLELALIEASQMLGARPVVPRGEGIHPFDFGVSEVAGSPASARFLFAVHPPDWAETSHTEEVSLLVVRASAETRIEDRRTVEQIGGTSVWWVRRHGDLIYHLQSESKPAVRYVADRLGWGNPESAFRPADPNQ